MHPKRHAQTESYTPTAASIVQTNTCPSDRKGEVLGFAGQFGLLGRNDTHTHTHTHTHTDSIETCTTATRTHTHYNHTCTIATLTCTIATNTHGQ